MTRLESKYVLDNQTEIYDYVSEHADMLDTLLAVADEFREVFGSDTVITLKKYDDLEFDETKLIAYIFSTVSVEESMEKMIELVEHRFHKYRKILDGRFMFDIR